MKLKIKTQKIVVDYLEKIAKRENCSIEDLIIERVIKPDIEYSTGKYEVYAKINSGICKKCKLDLRATSDFPKMYSSPAKREINLTEKTIKHICPKCGQVIFSLKLSDKDWYTIKYLSHKLCIIKK